MQKNSVGVAIGRLKAIFLLILRHYRLDDLLKIKLIKNAKKSFVCGDWKSRRDFFAHFEAYKLGVF